MNYIFFMIITFLNKNISKYLSGSHEKLQHSLHQ